MCVVNEGFAVDHLNDDLNTWMGACCGGARSWRVARAVGSGERASELRRGSVSVGARCDCAFL